MSQKTIFKKIEKKTKQRIYKWHKFFAYITFIPVLLWCLSGIMHPFMAHFFKPEIKNEFITPKAIDFDKVKITLQEILNKENIHEFKNFRFVEMNDVWFYQIKLSDNSLIYFNAANGKKLYNADVIYANYLAKFFLDDHQSKILKTEFLTKFDNQYKYLHTDLAIISIGTNDSFDPDFDSLKFEMNYEQFILKLKQQNENLALLLTVPNDSYAKRKINNKNTVIVKRVIERLAYKYEAKIWDFFSIMGGNHSAKNWRDAELMKSDLIHFTRSGYLLKGSLLFDAIMSDFYKWKEQQNQKIEMNK
jgi:hypothetical protein